MKSILDVPERTGFVRRWFRGSEVAQAENYGFERPTSSDSEKLAHTKLKDQVVDDLILMEAPHDKAAKFAYEVQGGELNERQQRALHARPKTDRDGGEERMSTETRDMPRQARIRRPRGE